MQHQNTSSAEAAAEAPGFNTNLPVGMITPNNLPAQLTALIGREEEVTTIQQLLQREDVHLVTLTGSGGVGKTRLALSIAATLLNDFPDGVSFVNLAPVRDPQFVITTIAKALDVQESADQPLLKRLTTALAGKHLLLLDNFEQVVSAAPLLSVLLESCSSLKMLVTSREALRVRGEREIEVQPLALPNLKRLPSLAALSAVAAVELFVQRAQAVIVNFQLTPGNAQVIAQICTRLDGLPLALELAVARLKLLSPQSLLARLEHRLQVLTRGSREVDERQQTLSNTLQWSYDLLSHQEQGLFRRVGVFSGGWTLAAAQAICEGAGGKAALDVENGLASLIDKSLVRPSVQTDGELRFNLLEIIREFALDCLERQGEMEGIRWEHAAYYLALAEQLEPELSGPQQVERLEQLEREHDNLRAALQWALEQAEAGDAQRGSELALRLGNELMTFWIVRCYWSEGRTFLEQALAASSGSVSPLRAKALLTAATLVYQRDDYDPAKLLAEESLLQYRQLGDSAGVAHCLLLLGAIVANQSDYPAARALTEESLVLARQGNDRVSIARLLVNLGNIVSVQGEYTRAQSLLEEALKIQEELGNKHGMAWAYYKLAWIPIISLGDPATANKFLAASLALARELSHTEIIVYCLVCSAQLALRQDDPPLAQTLLEESLALAREIGNFWATNEILCVLAKVAFIQGNYSAARSLCEESLKGARKIGSKELLAYGLERMAEVVAAQSEATRAAQLWGVAETLRETIGAPITSLERPMYERMVAQARTQLGEPAFTVAWAQGRVSSPEQALAPTDFTLLPYQAQQTPQALLPAQPLPAYSAGLTQREIEVLRLVAQGLTNVQIAERLIISPHTVNTHVSAILSKLAVNSRSAIIHFAFEHHLV